MKAQGSCLPTSNGLHCTALLGMHWFSLNLTQEGRSPGRLALSWHMGEGA